MAQLYTNAADVLPRALLEQVQKHWQGLMWIPNRILDSRRPDVLQLISQGVSAQEIAIQLGISRIRVYQIARSLGENNPFRKSSKHG